MSITSNRFRAWLLKAARVAVDAVVLCFGLWLGGFMGMLVPLFVGGLLASLVCWIVDGSDRLWSFIVELFISSVPLGECSLWVYLLKRSRMANEHPLVKKLLYGLLVGGVWSVFFVFVLGGWGDMFGD